ncbi:hypothetical protein GQ43DRAFT_428875 [Delitschia confertaspora ATCC 74209]|uniref:Methyltransferase domain-containing protein n=1 Tax=Delitschia confertaspora ATCC 74209 TaxID=1513339 RepID=A0A9P4MSS9_9PLEO|nr:hypothetical protein GQ43DRAFT_428875 [Delitschia confertaspora ATCC 74209]
MYNLDHGRLNLSMPPPSMWMNMGYWKNTDDLPIACKSLLEEVLSTANLTSTPTPWSLIDLGFGCGDQTALIAENSMSEKYVGITLDAQQFSYAESRLQSRKLLKLPFVQLFCADAGNPGEWSEELKRAIFECLEETTGEKWFLALDTAYHFKPDRWGVIQHASREQDASFMAFDLVLADKISSFQSLLMRLVTTLMGTPWANFVTEAEYRQMLVKCGYTEENITIRDISRHVFTPLVTFLERRDRELNSIGLSLGKFRAAGWLFKWWGRTGIIRGCIIVARKRPEDYLK